MSVGAVWSNTISSVFSAWFGAALIVYHHDLPWSAFWNTAIPFALGAVLYALVRTVIRLKKETYANRD
jgi:hypothetical protein